MIARDQVSEKTPHELWAQVERDGYAIIPDVLNFTEAEELLSKLAASQLQRSRAGVRHLLGHPAVSQIANDPQMLGMAQTILGQDAFPFRATLFDKSPDTNWLITWHQDTALPLREKVETAGWGSWSVKEGVIYAHAPADALEKVVALRLHLDDSTTANGPLRIVPETHRKGVLNDSEVEVIVAQQSGVICLIKKGGVIAMKPLSIHASSKSKSEIPRRVLHVEYASHDAVLKPLQLAIA